MTIKTPEGKVIECKLNWSHYFRQKEFMDKLENPLIEVFKNQK